MNYSHPMVGEEFPSKMNNIYLNLDTGEDQFGYQSTISFLEVFIYSIRTSNLQWLFVMMDLSLMPQTYTSKLEETLSRLFMTTGKSITYSGRTTMTRLAVDNGLTNSQAGLL